MIVTAEGARNCGCAWEHLDDGRVRFTRRCDDHQSMCRSIEQWEIQLVRPNLRADHPSPTRRGDLVMPDLSTDGRTVGDKRAALDRAIADALPISGGDVRKRLKQLRRALAAADREREPCAATGCGHTRTWHRNGRCAGDLLHCPCEEFKAAEL